MFYVDSSFKRHCIGTEFKFAWFPKRCHISKKPIWLKFAYAQTARWYGPGDYIDEIRWYDKHEFLIAKLKGMI